MDISPRKSTIVTYAHFDVLWAQLGVDTNMTDFRTAEASQLTITDHQSSITNQQFPSVLSVASCFVPSPIRPPPSPITHSLLQNQARSPGKVELRATDRVFQCAHSQTAFANPMTAKTLRHRLAQVAKRKTRKSSSARGFWTGGASRAAQNPHSARRSALRFTKSLLLTVSPRLPYPSPRFAGGLFCARAVPTWSYLLSSHVVSNERAECNPPRN
jgi:hypothetical protein